jgi:hypothetical protein
MHPAIRCKTLHLKSPPEVRIDRGKLKKLAPSRCLGRLGRKKIDVDGGTGYLTLKMVDFPNLFRSNITFSSFARMGGSNRRSA